MKAHPAAVLFPMLSDDELAALAEDIRQRGLLNPVLTHKGLILDGRNRWAACERAGVAASTREWDGLDAEGRVCSPYAFVWSLNAERRQIAAGQKGAIKLKVVTADAEWHDAQRKMREAANKARSEAAKAAGEARGGLNRAESRATLPATQAPSGPEKPRPAAPDKKPAKKGGEHKKRKEIAKAAGISERTAQDIISLEANRPDLFEKVAAGETTLQDAKRQVKQEQKEAIAEELRSKPLPMPDGRFNVLVLDPPWKYESRAEDLSHRARNPYPDMTLEEIAALPVAAKCEDDAIVWLWTTNAFMREAYTLADAWGLRVRTILTWTKDRMGTGDWLRGQTEHALLCTRGRPLVTLTNQTTSLRGPLREHSRKPDEFYALVDSLCPGTKLEFFAREARPGWQAWGAETEKF